VAVIAWSGKRAVYGAGVLFPAESTAAEFRWRINLKNGFHLRKEITFSDGYNPGLVNRPKGRGNEKIITTERSFGFLRPSWMIAWLRRSQITTLQSFPFTKS
jgi:hypothetical protein